MKTAIYIAESVVQLVLTPGNEEEKAILKIAETQVVTKVYRGAFYECRGGWYRHETHGQWDGHKDDDSLIFVMRPPEGE